MAFTWLYLLRTAPRHVFRYVLGGLPFAVPLLLYKIPTLSAAFFAFGQEIAAEGIAQTKGLTEVWQTSAAEGFAGLLVSPSRGLFVYSPFMVFGSVGTVMAWRDPRHYAPLIPLQAVLVQIVLAAMWFDWWGGYSYGPRPLVDVGVFLTLLMIPILARVGPANCIRGIFVTLLLYSVAVQAIGAWAYNESGWNDKDGKNIDRPEHRSRLWAVGDSQIVHYATHLQAERKRKQDEIYTQLCPWQIFVPSPPGKPSP
ncbi:MAG: hypothetical protein OXR07_04765 [Nitrospira sp.]|nr:hypothetical protein [Nitrospira sp.]